MLTEETLMNMKRMLKVSEEYFEVFDVYATKNDSNVKPIN